MNDTLHSGSCFLPSFQEILCFLLGQVALVTDIHQTFLQIEIDNLHRDYLQFMWYENMENPNFINIYRFIWLVFGLICAPFILNATVKVHVQKLHQWRNDSNFDTFFTRPICWRYCNVFWSASKALEFYSVCKQVLLKGGFQLQKWKSNNVNLQKDIREKKLITVILVQNCQ